MRFQFYKNRAHIYSSYDRCNSFTRWNLIKIKGAYNKINLTLKLGDRIIFATIDGHLKIWTAQIENEEVKCQFLKSKKIHDGKIFSLAVLSDTEMVTCGQKGEMKLISISKEGDVLVRQKLVLPESKEQRWFSCASLVMSNGLAVGDRCGNLHFYR